MHLFLVASTVVVDVFVAVVNVIVIHAQKYMDGKVKLINFSYKNSSRTSSYIKVHNDYFSK